MNSFSHSNLLILNNIYIKINNNIKLILPLLFSILFLHPLISNAENLKYLQLDIGTDRPNFPICSNKESASPTHKRICWISKPRISGNGEKSGFALIPNELTPKWATYAMHDLHVNKKNGIRGISTRTFGCNSDSNLNDILTSIESRFGKSRDTIRSRPLLMDWHTSDGYIGLFSNEDLCVVTYRSPELQAEVVANIAKIKKAEQQRSSSP